MSELVTASLPEATSPTDSQKVAHAIQTFLLMIQVEGHADVFVACAVGDHSSQAPYVCNSVTNTECIYQSYDCWYGNQGSWYPPVSGAGGANFNFAFTYDMHGNYGNICACTQSFMATYGLGATHQYCGLGRWVRQ